MILNQEGDTEFVINRQNSKIAFLQSENNALQDDNQDLQNAIKMNLDALRIASDQNQQNKQSGQSTVINDNQSYNTSAAQEILERQIAENKYLLKAYQRCSKERTQLATQNLLLSQVNDETAKFYKDVIHDLEEKVLELRRIIQDKEYTIQTLEKKLTLPDKDGVLLKIKEIVTPNEQTIPLHAEIEKHKMQCDILTKQIKTLFTENSEIKQANIAIKHELLKITTCLHNNVGYQNYKQFIKGSLTQDDAITFPQKSLISQIFNYQQQSNFQQVQQKTPNATLFSSLLLQDIEGYFLTNFSKVPRHLLPGSQQNWKGSMKSPRDPQSRVDLIQKIEQLEDHQEKLKKLYYKATKNAKAQFYEILERRKETSRMNLQITTLQKSNRQYENKFKNQQGESDFYKQFFQNYMLDIQRQRRNSLDQKAKQNYYHKKHDEEDEEDEDQQKQKQAMLKEQGLENFLEDLQENKKENLDYLFKDDYLGETLDNEQYQYIWKKLNNHLNTIGPLIEQLIKKPNLESLQKEQPVNRVRSMSDPFVYFNISIQEKRKLIKGWKKPKETLKSGAVKSNRNNFNTIDTKQSPFFMDLSAIGPEIAQNQKKYNAQKKSRPQNNQQQQQNQEQGRDQSFGIAKNQNLQQQQQQNNQQQDGYSSNDDDVDLDL